MTEEFLHYIWRYRLLQNIDSTTEGEKIKILNPGSHNTDAGPDFLNARIIIGDTNWAGNVEIHVNSSDWLKHSHQNDKFYQNIILHIVYNHDVNIYRNNNQKIPTIELKGKFDEKIFNNYKAFIDSKITIACRNSVADTSSLLLKSFIERLIVERISRKTSIIDETLIINNNNWEQTFYQFIAMNLGFKLNSLPFELLAKSTPLQFLLKNSDSLFTLEALLFGQAGMLNKSLKDEYPVKLYKEYTYLKQKYSLEPIDPSLWKFLRLRPNNFPTIRISQLAYLIYKEQNLFSKTLEADNINFINKIFDLHASEYWTNHYVFDKESKTKIKSTGIGSINNILINTIVAFLFIYGIKKNNQTYKDRAINLLEEIKAEKNFIVKMWNDAGISSSNALDSQALIELYNEYCKNKKCLSCTIGNSLIRQ